MKKTLMLNVFLLIFITAISQITVIGDKLPAKADMMHGEVCPYDSMSNLRETGEYGGENYGYKHLIGQTMMYCGDPWKFHFFDSFDFPVGDYYFIKNVTIYKHSSLKKYCVFELENTKTHEIVSFENYNTNYNANWVVLGYYEKQKEKYIGKEFVYINLARKTVDGLFSLDADTVTAGIEKESVWKCVDVAVKIRTASMWKYEHDDNRCPVVLVLDNPKYGKHYCYIEDKFGWHFDDEKEIYKASSYGLPLICGKFIDKASYDHILALNAQQKAQKRKELTRKFGKTNADLILDGIIEIGMTKEMCREAWGEPDEINTTITAYGTTEQWCYGFSYVYFKGNRITVIQN